MLCLLTRYRLRAMPTASLGMPTFIKSRPLAINLVSDIWTGVNVSGRYTDRGGWWSVSASELICSCVCKASEARRELPFALPAVWDVGRLSRWDDFLPVEREGTWITYPDGMHSLPSCELGFVRLYSKPNTDGIAQW